MKKQRILVVCILIMLCLLMCVGCESGGKGMIVGKKIKIEDITDFYYTYDSSTDPPDFLRYRFFVQDGTYWFHYEKREGDHWPLTEEDVSESVDVDLTQDQWQQFFAYLEGGSVTAREESVTSGDSGPWMYLYWKKDKSKYQVFEFESWGRQKEFEEFCKQLKDGK